MKPGPLHVTMLATPGLGHLIPLVELAMLLAVRRDIPTMLINFASAASATQRKLVLN
jgi:hydroquinone glucosyltransferase